MLLKPQRSMTPTRIPLQKQVEFERTISSELVSEALFRSNQY